jgi:hypothetical protein
MALGSLSLYVEKKVLDILGGTTFPAPATVYIGLCTVAPSETAAGTEVSGGGYGRYTATNNATNWPAAAGTGAAPSTKSNGVVFTWGTGPTANWGIVVAFGIFDAPTAGNLLWMGPITPNKTINNLDPAPSFAVGAIALTAD